MVIDGTRMLIALFIGIAVLIVLVLKTKVQAFLALILTTVLIGVIGGVPLAATEVTTAAGTKATISIVNSITGGFGGEIAAIVAKEAFGYLDAPIERVASPDTPVPFSPTLEDAYLPNPDKIVEKALTMF